MPSEAHTELIRRSLIWLSNIATGKGIRACPEMTLGEGYIADGGAILNLQFRWAWEFFERQIPPYNDDFTFVLEAKVSKGDFNKTFVHGNHVGDRMKPIANFHFVVMAKGLQCEAPDFWGCLEESRNGLRLVKLPRFCPEPSMSLHEFAYRILRFSDVRKYMILDLKECHGEEDAEPADLFANQEPHDKPSPGSDL